VQVVHCLTVSFYSSTPQNPTGAVIPKTTLEEIVKIAREHSISILSDEIYRPLFHSISPTDPDFPPSILSLGYENAIATSSLSKVYSLAGLRVGWIASNSSSIVDLCINARSYALISVSHIDEHVASFALGPARVDNLLERNTTLVKRNLALVESFIEEHSSICEWVEPAGAPIGFVKFTRSGEPVDDFELCRSLLEKKGLLLVPGSKCFVDGKHLRGYVRIGFGGDTAELRAGLKALGEAIKDNYSALPLL
jgi:aspartate/methionine/tyrosine aminotransferase